MKRSAVFLLLFANLVTGCSYVDLSSAPQIRGNRVTADQLKDLVPGTSTRADASSLLGSPTAKGSFDDNTWIYISETTQPRVGRVQGINSQDVVQLTFDDRGILRDMKQLSKKDAMDVSVVARATPSPGSEATFMQQLLGNVGRFSAGPTGATPGGGGSSTTLGAK